MVTFLSRIIGTLRRRPGRTSTLDCVTSDRPSMTEIFTTIYQTNAWLNDETCSGPGSTVARCQPVIRALTDLIDAFGVKSLLDAPCGDFNWMKEVPLSNVKYIGVDVVPEMIDRNQKLYGNSRREFRCLDITRGPLPRVDMIFCRDCLVHLSHANVFKALATFKRSGSRLLVATTFTARTTNEDITTGGWQAFNLERAPFFLPAPLRVVSDGCPDPNYLDKTLGVWRIEQLPG
jgi:SAM-dependent methyltransferase